MITRHNPKERIVYRQDWECDWKEGIYGKQKLEYKVESITTQERQKKT
jgi:hypothetical protein